MVVSDVIDTVHLLVFEVVAAGVPRALVGGVGVVGLVLHGVGAENVGAQVFGKAGSFADTNLEVDAFAAHVLGVLDILKLFTIFVAHPAVIGVLHHHLVVDLQLAADSSLAFTGKNLAVHV